MCDAASPRAAPLKPMAISQKVVASCWVVILTVDGASLAFFQFHKLSNLYGDGIAHVDAARRLFDSLTSGYPEIGRAWLPLAHVLASKEERNFIHRVAVTLLTQ